MVYTLRLTDRWPVPDVLYADRYGLRVVCLRLGGVQDRPLARSWLPGWLSGPDVVRFVGAALPADVRFGVYHGVSANSAPAPAHRPYAGRPGLSAARQLPAGLSDGTGPGQRLLHLT